MARLVKQARVGDFMNQAERNQRGGMSMNNAGKLRTPNPDLLVDGQFRRRLAHAFDLAVCAEADNVVAPQCAFVQAGRGDPHITTWLANGQIAAAGGCHAIAIDPLHRLKNLFSRMLVTTGCEHIDHLFLAL
jgi:hypothetical protein